MDEATNSERRAFACIVFDLQNLRWRYFGANMKQNTIIPRAGIPPDCDRLATKLALLPWDCFLGSFQIIKWYVVEE